MKSLLLALGMLLMLGSDVRAQVYDIPSEYRGTVTRVARGVMDGNLIETNYRNHGELSRWDDVPLPRSLDKWLLRLGESYAGAAGARQRASAGAHAGDS